MHRLSSTLICLILTGSAAQAADTFSELRFSLGFVPGIKEAEIEGQNGSGTVEIDPTAGVNLDAGFAFGRMGDGNIGIGGYVGLFLRDHEGKDDADVNTSVAAYGVNLGVDLLLASSQKFMVSIGPRLAVGGANQNIDLVEYESGQGGYASFGIQAGGYAALNDKVRVGLELGMMSWSSSATQTFDNGVVRGDLDITMSGSGAYGALVLSVSL